MTFDPTSFFDSMRSGILGPTLDPDEVSGCNMILDAMRGAPLSHCAYAFATAYHETAGTMQPIKEHGGPKYFTKLYDIRGDNPKRARRMGNIFPGDGPRYCGRGFVQLTWRNNYGNAGRKLKIALEDNPDLAMRDDVAAKVMRLGMDEGWFTGKKFNHYLPAAGPAGVAAFKEARRIINGVDKADRIAKYALQFQSALQSAGWKP